MTYYSAFFIFEPSPDKFKTGCPKDPTPTRLDSEIFDCKKGLCFCEAF